MCTCLYIHTRLLLAHWNALNNRFVYGKRLKKIERKLVLKCLSYIWEDYYIFQQIFNPFFYALNYFHLLTGQFIRYTHLVPGRTALCLQNRPNSLGYSWKGCWSMLTRRNHVVAADWTAIHSHCQQPVPSHPKDALSGDWARPLK
jgi:hypothetical protein